jgi:hypothetical protein
MSVAIFRIPLVFSSAALMLFLSSCAATHPVDVPFETFMGVTLSDIDKTNILQIARLASDKPILKVEASPQLPRSMPIVVVTYHHEVFGTYVIETKLTIYERDSRRWIQSFLDSLIISRGRWGSKPELLQWEVLRAFAVDETTVNLRVPDGMSYHEMLRLLKAIKNKEIIWEDQRPWIKDFAIDDVTRVALEGSEPLYVVHIIKKHSPPYYSVYARFEGAKLVVKRTEAAIP